MAFSINASLPTGIVFILFLYINLVSAVPFFTNSTVPTNLTTTCSNALLKDVTGCTSLVPVFRNGFFYLTSSLEKTCTPACSTALASYEGGIASACVGQSWAGYDDGNDMPLDIIPNLIKFQYDLTCLQDSGRWCNVVAASAAVGGDPGLSPVGWDSSAINGSEPSGPCDLCLIKNLQMQAASPYYDGPELRSQSIYDTKTSSCGVTNLPLATSTLSFSTTPAACTGKTYAITSGDSCYSISKSQGIGTAWLLSDNNLGAYCSDFPSSGNLCLTNTCDTVEVGVNSTCKEIAKAANITESQLKAWNPSINAGCYNVEKMNGTQVCISGPGTPYVVPHATVTLAPSIASTAVAVPTDAADAVNRNCGRWYHAVSGDYCNLLTLRFSISLQDFVFLNPPINENCTNLFAEESYCVQAVGDINTYSGRPGYHTLIPSNTASFIPLVLTPTTAATTIPTPTALPLAPGTRDDCSNMFDGAIFQKDITGTMHFNQCDFAADIYRVDIEDFGLWNPDIGNVSLSTCSFKPGTQYCGKLFSGQAPLPVAGPSFSLPLRIVVIYGPDMHTASETLLIQIRP
ncbi:hypothetical protein HYALB_00003325 [Hymenoscyphus albidus]|uniref:LysM domain-containing protein n=1 Tax=Hymenoscyphus albidus TaxID=595503 RepID=A0A9N9Q233_9HELO|nr:hypothetical protein HYALB_00003325 [Hymenoscyphus albidus]